MDGSDADAVAVLPVEQPTARAVVGPDPDNRGVIGVIFEYAGELVSRGVPKGYLLAAPERREVGKRGMLRGHWGKAFLRV